ncbi:hypothetical protein ACIBF5_09910 [Micromonospora sp. NPDC050417]|uniref:hypothetical protein n=1 Tax=Micromonospora sp. NPDC050417 TaxID=3364280 RepID=UPI0037AF9C0C
MSNATPLDFAALVVAAAPPLTSTQITDLRRLLAPRAASVRHPAPARPPTRTDSTRPGPTPVASPSAPAEAVAA